jgi:hypothetical protein
VRRKIDGREKKQTKAGSNKFNFGGLKLSLKTAACGCPQIAAGGFTVLKVLPLMFNKIRLPEV